MKRQRLLRVPEYGPAKRTRLQCVKDVFRFDVLLPEMQGEVMSHLALTERSRMARTCKAYWAKLHAQIPVLPEAWYVMWDTVAREPIMEWVRIAQGALRELIEFGVPHWPGAFHHGAAHYRPDQRQLLRDRDPILGPMLCWQWRDDHNHTYYNLTYGLDYGSWDLTHVPDGGRFSAYRPLALSTLPDTAVANWKEHVAKPGRRRPDTWTWDMRPFEFDHD